MATLGDLFTALERADAAGNVEDARAIASMIQQFQTPVPKTSTAGYIRETLKAIPRGAVRGLESAGLGLAALLPDETEKTAREKIKSVAESLAPSVAPEYKETIPIKLGEAVGSIGSLLIPGLGAGRAAGALGAGAAGVRAAQRGTARVLAPAMGAGEARERAMEAGATPEQIRTSTQLGAFVGLSELAPIERMFRGLGKELTGGFIERVKRAAVTGGLEGAQEAAAQIAQNLIAQQVYKPSQELLESAGESGAYGAGAGAIVQFLLDAATGRRAPPAAASAPTPTAPIPTSAQQPLFGKEEAPAPTTPQAPLRAYTPSGELLTAERPKPQASAADLTADLESAYNELERADREVGGAKARLERTQDPNERVRLYEALEPLTARQKQAEAAVNRLRQEIKAATGEVIPTRRQAAAERQRQMGMFDFEAEPTPAPAPIAPTAPIPTSAQQPLFGEEEAPAPTTPQAPLRAYTPSGELLTAERPKPQASAADLTADLERAYNELERADREVGGAKARLERTQDPSERVRLYEALESLTARQKQAEAAVNRLRREIKAATGEVIPTREQIAAERQRQMGVFDFEAGSIPGFVINDDVLKGLGFKAAHTRKAFLKTLEGVDVSTPEGYATFEDVMNKTRAKIDEPLVTDFMSRAREAFPPLPFQPTEGPRTRLTEPTVIGEQPAAPVPPEVELDFIRQRYEAGLPLTPAEQYRLREAQKAAPTPELALPGQPAAPTQPLEVVENLPRQTPPLELTETQIPQPIEPPYSFAPMPAFVTDDALKSMGLAKRRDKAAVALREELLAKDMNDPADVQAVRAALRAYRDRPMTPKVTREKIDNYLRAIPEQQEIDFERRDQTGQPPSEPSVAPSVPRRRARRPRPATVGQPDVDVPSGATEQRPEGTEPQLGALEAPQEAPQEASQETEPRSVAPKPVEAWKQFAPAGVQYTQLSPEARAAWKQNVEGQASPEELSSLAKDLSEDTRYSEQTPREPTGNTVEQVNAAIQKASRPGSELGRIVTVVQSEAGLPAEVRKPGVRGVAYKGRAYLVADNIAPGEELGVLLHEAGAHLGFDKIFTPEGRKNLANQVRNWAKGDDLKGRVAREAIERGGKSDDEVIAYTVEGLVNGGVKPTAVSAEASWLKRVLNAMRSALRKLGFMRDVSPQELVDMAYGAAQLEVSPTEVGPRYSVASTGDPNLDRLNQQRIEQVTRDGDRPFMERLLKTFTDLNAFKNFAGKFAVSVVDNMYVAKRILSKGGQWESVFHMAFASRAGDIAATSLLTGPIRLQTLGGGRGIQTFKVVQGTSMREVLDSLTGIANSLQSGTIEQRFAAANAMFDNYTIVERFNSLSAAQKAMYKIPRATFDAAREARRLYGPQLRAALDAWTEYKNALLDANLAAGRFSAEDVAAWKEAADYVPWHRILDDANHGYETKSSAKAFFSSSLQATGRIKELLGGDIDQRPIGSVFQNMQSLAFWLSTSAIKNHAAVKVADVLGSAAFNGKQVGSATAPGVDKNKVIKVYKNGKETFYELDDPLAAYAFMPIIEATGPILEALSKATQLVRKGTTLMPGFTVNQLFQDSQRVLLYSGVNNPYRVGASVFGNFIGALREDPVTQELNKYGLQGQVDYIFSGKFGEKSRAAAQLAPMNPGVRKGINYLVGKLDQLSHASDMAQRKAVYEQTMKETNGDEALALFRAIEIINFQNRGASKLSSILRQSIPFFNAYVQGMNVTYRAMTKEGITAKDRQTARRQFYSLAAKVGAFSLLYAWFVSDDEEYQQMSPNDQMRGWLLPGSREKMKELTGVDIGQNLKIPVPMDAAGLLAKGLPELFYNYLATEGTATEMDNRKLLRAMRDGVVNAVAPSAPIPQAVKPSLELLVNYSFFTGRPIIGKGQESLESFRQYTETTSELAKAIGEATNISPIKLDYFIRGMLGMFGGTLLHYGSALYGSASKVEVPESRLSDNPQLRAFFSGREGSGLRQDYYDLRDKIDTVNRTVNDIMRKTPDKLQDYLEENKELYALAASGFTGKMDKWVAMFREARQAVLSSGVSAEEKRARIAELEKQEVEMFARASLPQLRKFSGM